MMRSAEAFGASGVVFLKGSRASVQSEKRARLGRFDLSIAVRVRRRGVAAACGARPSQGPDIRRHAIGRLTAGEADLTGNCAIVIGSEGRGISAELAA